MSAVAIAAILTFGAMVIVAMLLRNEVRGGVSKTGILFEAKPKRDSRGRSRSKRGR